MKTRTLFCMGLCALLLTGCVNPNKKASKDKAQPAKEQTQKTMATNLAFDPATLPAEPVFVMKTSMGDMVIKLYAQTPQHRDNFVKLCSERFYDGLLFHRVIEGFMIQGGDPGSRNAGPEVRLGSGSTGYTIPAEFVPELRHKKGALAAARTNNPEKASSGCQFYIVHDPYACAQLDMNYTVYGEVIEGLEVIDKIAAVPTRPGDRPVEDVKILSVLPR